ncbi:DUF4019 domain-containing protein [Ramlibacter sp. G-1-2-2]|uniref:DUF4019 domain-containing protein n=1 Tax=Ramlibacter agri TaxID=2728837 RepID=A0A848H6T3_9BURK|nr:DUF4019 domain-containing protein [Ramlibacter agri]NML46686.1 DUF4019 domain-containing protein [Ramlibacter agri]
MKVNSRLSLLALGLALCAGAQAQPAAAPAAAAASAPSVEDMAKAGQLAATGWLTLLDRNDWGTAWDASAAMFRSSVPLGTWMDKVPPVRQPLGPLVEREPVEAIYKTSLPGRPDGQYVTVRFLSKFQKGTLQEIVATVREQDGRWRVTGYQPSPAN